MVEGQFSWDGDVEPVIRKYAKRVFRGKPNEEELVDDAVSVGWEAWNAAQKVIRPDRFAYYACVRVSCERHFQQSERSIETKSTHKVVKPRRVPLRAAIATKPGEDPAAIACLQIDYDAWQPTLSELKASCLEGCLLGETTGEMAVRIEVSRGRVSQIRRELLVGCKAFTS